MKLDNNYSLSFNGTQVTLEYSEYRIKLKRDSTREDYLFKDYWHFPNTKMALIKYLSLCVDNCDEISDIVDEINACEKRIYKMLNPLDANVIVG